MLPPVKDSNQQAAPVAGPERFECGDLVEVQDKRTGLWWPASVLRRWAEVDIPSGFRSNSYDVQGEWIDGEYVGPFHGTFDELHIRQRQTEVSQAPAGGKTS
jgi:hypothetical protein